MRALTELRDTVADLLDTQARCRADNDFAAVQARLNRLYDRYVSKFRNGDQMADAEQARRCPEPGASGAGPCQDELRVGTKIRPPWGV